MNKTIIALSVVIVIFIGIGIYVFTHQTPDANFVAPVGVATNTATGVQGTVSAAPPTSAAPQEDKTKTVIGTSVEGRNIIAYHYGTGAKELLFVGGIHGGYEWNTVLVAYNLMDYLSLHPEVVPATVTVTVIPVLDPDGLNKVVGTSTGRFTALDVSPSQDVQIAGRFNANNVDLNRNFDCDWQASGVWQQTNVSGGSAAFSEPESQAIKQYVESHSPAAVVVYNSAAGGVYSSNCHNGVLAETTALTDMYAKASGYPAYENFDFYSLTGDMTNWLAKEHIPAISVLLTTHTDVEWNKNQAGITALLQHYGAQ